MTMTMTMTVVSRARKTNTHNQKLKINACASLSAPSAAPAAMEDHYQQLTSRLSYQLMTCCNRAVEQSRVAFSFSHLSRLHRPVSVRSHDAVRRVTRDRKEVRQPTRWSEKLGKYLRSRQHKYESRGKSDRRKRTMVARLRSYDLCKYRIRTK